MKSIEVIQVICFLSLVFVIFFSIKKLNLANSNDWKKIFALYLLQINPHQKGVGDSWYCMQTRTFLWWFFTGVISVCLMLECNKNMKVPVPNANTKLLGKIISWGLQFLQKLKCYLYFLPHIIVRRRWCTLQYFGI